MANNHDVQDNNDPQALDKKQDEGEAEEQSPQIFEVKVILPHEPYETTIHVSAQEQIQDVRQSITDFEYSMQYSCFHLEHKGERMNDFVELSEVPGVENGSEFKLVEDPYTEKDARLHLVRVRELIGAAGDRTNPSHGISAGMSLVEDVVPFQESQNGTTGNGKTTNGVDQDDAKAAENYGFDTPGSYTTLVPKPQQPTPSTVKSISLSPWNPPPYHLRTRGHLLYLTVTILEGEVHQITSHVSGFYVNNCRHDKFDPSPKKDGKAAHSLLTLLSQMSPEFGKQFKLQQQLQQKKDALALIPLSNAIPASPWIVSPSATTSHQSDITRTQEQYLYGGSDGAETLRDWNEEFQSTRELPKESMQDQVFRERLISKLFADFNEAATRGATMVARGEVIPLNPTEGRDAQIFVHNNIFFSFGADGVGTFATEGGDEAARVATGKDAVGVKAVNQLDITGLFTPGTTVVDYLGKRIVAQSIVPGIFKQREPGEHQIDYGGVEGKDVVAEDERFAPLLQKLSESMHVKKHAVWDKEQKRHDLEASIETKGLLGTDGRKYVLDLYRITPLDVAWVEQHWSEVEEGKQKEKEKDYPHRMAVLRPELVASYYRYKLQHYIAVELDKQKTNGSANGVKSEADTNGDTTMADADSTSISKGEISENGQVAKTGEATEQKESSPPAQIDISGFKLELNPDVFCGQSPQTDEEVEEIQKDEQAVRDACAYLTDKVIPTLVAELKEGEEVGFPMDGASLCALLHKRGVNVRYLGHLATHAKDDNARLRALQQLAVQEMVARGFKHVANQKLRHLPPPLVSSCIAHLLNCLLGTDLEPKPDAESDSSLERIYPDGDLSFKDVTPKSLREEIVEQIRIRYRYDLKDDLVQPSKHLQLLREVALKLGIQLKAKEYQFSKSQPQPQDAHTEDAQPLANGHTNGVHKPAPAPGKSSKNKKKNTAPTSTSPSPTFPPVTFQPDDILNITPVVKEASPRSVLADNALEAGRISMAQGNREIGQSLYLESLSLYEQVYGILHPEVANAYLQLSSLYYSLDEKAGAVELARKAVIVAERTLGVDSAQTILSYLNLGLFEHATGNGKTALQYFLHAFGLLKVVYGTNHPDSITTMNNVAVILQGLHMYHASKIWFEATLRLSKAMYGEESHNIATVLFQLSQALALDDDLKGATERMREARNTFEKSLGANHENTKQADEWLGKLVSSAVARQKQQQIGGMRLPFSTHNRPFPQIGQARGEAVGSAAGRKMGEKEMDERDINELVGFIMGQGQQGGGQKTPKKSANPKRRTSRAAQSATA